MAINEVKGKDDIDNYVVSSPQPQGQCHDTARGRYGGEREVEQRRCRDKGHDHDHHYGDHKRDHSERRDRKWKRDRGNDDYDRPREYDRQRDHKEDRHRYRSRSREDSSEQRPMLLSRSQYKRKRRSGFDVAPSLSNWIPDATSLSDYGGGNASTVAGMFPNMFSLAPAQSGAQLTVPVQARTQQATRFARRVYVGGLSSLANEQALATFFSHVMSAIGGNTAGPGDAVVNVYINREKKFAFIEMRSVEEASNAMALDGIVFQGAPIKVGRPTDYNPSSAATLGPTWPNPNLNLSAVGLTTGSAGGLQAPDRIFVGGIPYYLTEAQIRELLETFGPLCSFDLVKDRATGNSKGYAFCVYQELSVTDIACAALNGLKMGDKIFTVRRANQVVSPPKPEQERVLLNVQQQMKLVVQASTTATKVLCLEKALTADELKEDEEYEYILEDMRMECGKFGDLINMVIPRPSPNGKPSPGVGKVFLEYADIFSAIRARQGLNGRKYDGNQVVATFYPESRFSQGDFEA